MMKQQDKYLAVVFWFACKFPFGMYLDLAVVYFF